MKFVGRLKLVFGILVVVILVGLLTLYLNKTMSMAQAFRAQIAADTQDLGTPFAGQVASVNVHEGDRVKKGQLLATVHSPTLLADLSSSQVKATTLDLTLDKANNIEITAPSDGVISKIDATTGASVAGGVPVVELNPVGSLYIVSYYHLNPPDYARIHNGALVDVTLPDNSKWQAKIFAINLSQDGSVVDTVVKARLIRPDMSSFRFAIGTPVQATMRFTDKLWYESLIDSAKHLIQPGGK